MSDPGLNETALLDGQSVIINLINETFDDPLEAVNFALGGTQGVNYPAGLTITSVTRNSATSAEVFLDFAGDFDIDYTDIFFITVAAADLAQTSSGVLVPGNRLTITAFGEIPQATLSTDSILEERRLDARTLTIDLTQETFIDPGSLVAGDFTLNNAPGGLSIAGIISASSIQAVLDLAFTPGDFDTDLTDFSITIDQSLLLQSSTDLTTIPSLLVIANIESATLEPDTLIENTLDGSVLTITLVNEVFNTTGSIDPGNFDLDNEPVGFSIASASISSSTEAQLTMQYAGQDFDVDITNVRIGIDPSILRFTSSEFLSANAITIQAIVENPVADLTSDAFLHEYNLVDRELYIYLVEETFSDPGALVTDHFILQNHPPGLEIASVSGTSTTSATLLMQFDGTDFDVDYPDFHILIDYNVLVQSTENLATSSINIAYGLEPLITNLSIPNDTMKIDDVIPVTITVEDDRGFTYSLAPAAVIGGHPLTGLTRLNDTTYISYFTVIENLPTYPAGENIPVQVRLLNGEILGNIYTDPIIQDSDLLDASRPVFQYIYSTEGAQDIGSEIILWIQADGSNYTFTPTSQVNYVPISNSSIEITPSGSGRYRLSYVVQEGDNDVSQGELTLSMEAVDQAGNISAPFTEVDAVNLSIDASRPVITQAYVSSTDDDIIVGETLEITVRADRPGYRNNPNTWINNIHVAPPHLTFIDLGDNRYRYSYTVEENDGSVTRGNLAINIVLQDAVPHTNTSLPFTNLDPNNVAIITERPSATIISGEDEICAGESTGVIVLLGGRSPWELTFSDGSSTFQRTSMATTDTFFFSPEIPTIYTIERVVDLTGNWNEGAGEASITVHQMPDIRISNLDSQYDVKSPPVVLEYTPEGGYFTGQGITESPWTFNPSQADTATSPPHVIEYVYTDEHSCIFSHIREVRVVSGLGTISFEKLDVCFYDSTLLVTGFNLAGTTGSFSVDSNPPSGAFENLGNDTAILRPYLFAYDGNLDLMIYYSFTDSTGSPIKIEKPLTIEYLEDAVIYEPPSLDFCQNEDPIDLNGNYDGMTGGYKYTGPGVVNNSGNYYFDPARALQGANKVVYEYVSARQCRVSDSVDFIVYDAPDAGFVAVEPCIPVNGGVVQFQSRSDTGASVRWLWDFGDPASGTNNRSDLENPIHYYNDTGTYTISLTVSIGNCDEHFGKTMDINQKPDADFIWSSDCHSDETPILMTGTELLNYPDSVILWTWKIDSADTEIFWSDTIGKVLSYSFSSAGTYRITYGVHSNAGCTDFIEKEITLSKTYFLYQDSSYFEGFELESHGWEVMPKSSQNSWTFEPVNPDKFPEDAASGDRAWYTALPDVRSPENSWVVSPCFNFEDFYRPMVSLDIKRSLREDREGATLQYTLGHGNPWRNVGGIDDGGLEWYYSESIVPSIGGQIGGKSVGWTGELGGSEDEHWYESAHGLDELAGEPEVRFRIAFGSMGDSETGDNDGFAFDNFNIRQRTRLSVLEYFTNANIPKCADTDTVIMEIMNKVRADVIDIQYHAMGSMADIFYLENPVPANNRGTIYGVTSIPMAILDGGIDNEQLGYPMVYDFSSSMKFPSVEDIRLRSLMDPEFKLTITITQYTPSLKFSIEMEALRDLVRKERTLYAIVLQRLVDDPEYVGTNGIPVFRHVARKMLPGAGGTYLGSKGWSKGETEYADLTYPSPFFPLIQDSIVIVVFMQDDDTREILQAATNPQYTVSTFDELEPPPQVLIYPNPARDLVNVYFEKSPTEEMQFTLYDLSGKMVITDVIEPWQQQFIRSLGDVEQGLYIVEIRTRDRRRVLYRDKLLHY
ncbi:MAG: hypothetical protein AMS23_06095 [Bacteroides sp. SM1_62]|nr:MAG: hypothetical protein AMS23_06095 [Bacteroides sp. SM1_62]